MLLTLTQLLKKRITNKFLVQGQFCSGLALLVLTLFFFVPSVAQMNTSPTFENAEIYTNPTLDETQDLVENGELGKASEHLTKLDHNASMQEIAQFWYIKGVFAERVFRTEKQRQQKLLEDPAREAISAYLRTIKIDTTGFYASMAEKKIQDLRNYINGQVRAFLQDEGGKEQLNHYQNLLELERKTEYLYRTSVHSEEVHLHKQTKQYLEEMVTANPDQDREIYWMLLESSNLLRDSLDLQIRYVERARRQYPGDTGLIHYETRLMEQDTMEAHHDDLISLYNELIRLHPTDQGAILHLAMEYYESGIDHELEGNERAASMNYNLALDTLGKIEDTESENPRIQQMITDIEERLLKMENE